MSRQEDDLLKRHALLLEKRHIVVHRGTVKTGVKEEVTEWAVNVSTYGTSAYFDPAFFVSSYFAVRASLLQPKRDLSLRRLQPLGQRVSSVRLPNLA